MTDHELARLRFDCFMQAQQFSRPALPADGVDKALGFLTPRVGITVDEAVEIAGKIEAFCLGERGTSPPFDYGALRELREEPGGGY